MKQLIREILATVPNSQQFNPFFRNKLNVNENTILEEGEIISVLFQLCLPQMKLQTFANIILIVLTTLPISALDHEKSLLVQDSFSSIHCIAVHKNSILISNSNDVVQRDLDTGEIQRTFRAHQSFIMSFLVTGDSRLITSSYDDMIIVWDFDNGSIIQRISIRASGAQIQRIVYKDETIFVGSYDMKVRQIDLVAGRVVKTLGKFKFG